MKKQFVERLSLSRETIYSTILNAGSHCNSVSNIASIFRTSGEFQGLSMYSKRLRIYRELEQFCGATFCDEVISHLGLH